MAAVVPSGESHVGGGAHRPLGLQILRIAGFGLGGLLAFVLVALGVALVGINVAPGRRFVVAKVNQALAGSFQGHIEIEGLKTMGPFGLGGVNVTITDPSGRPVLVARGVSVGLATWTTVHSALFEKSAPLTIRLIAVSGDDLDVRLDTDSSGQLDLVNAFAPKGPASPPDPHARGTRIVIEGISMKHVRAHGIMSGAPPLDVEVNGLRGSFSFAPDSLEGDIAESNVIAHGIANGADVAGALKGHVRDPNGPLSGLDARVAWRGTAGTLAHTLDASMEHSVVSAILDAPTFTPESVRGLWPGSPIGKSGKLHAEVSGTWPSLDVNLRGSLGEAALEVKGDVVVANDKKADLVISAHDIDAHQFAGSAPSSSLGLAGNVSASQQASGAIELSAALRFLGGTAAGRALPSIDIRATGAGASAKALHAHVDVNVNEPGAPTKLAVDVTPKGSSYFVAATLESNIEDLRRLPELKGALSGSAHLSARGTLDLEPLSIEATLDARVANVVRGPMSVASGTAHAHASGPLANMALDGAVHAVGLVAGSRHLAVADVRITGTKSALHVVAAARGSDVPSVDARLNLDLGGALSLRALTVSLDRVEEHAVVTADKIDLGSGDVRVEGGRIVGLGAPVAVALQRTNGSLRVKLSTDGLDIGRAGRLAHLESTLHGGTIAVHTNVDIGHGWATGNGTFDMTDVGVADVRGLSAHGKVALNGREFHGQISAQAPALGSIDIDAPKLDLGAGDVLSASSWRQAWGDVSFNVHADIANLSQLIPADDRPFGEARGNVVVEGHYGRSTLADLTPDLTLSLKTDGLALAPNTPRARDIDGVMVVGPAPWHLEGVDFNLDATLRGDKGIVELALEAHDQKGELAKLDASFPHFPYQDVFDVPGRLAIDARTSPFDVKMTVPQRGLGGLPTILKQDVLSGRVQGEIHATGTASAPQVTLTARVDDPEFSLQGRRVPMTIDLSGQYDGRRATVSVKMGSTDRPILDADTTVDAPIGPFLSGDAAPAWSASARAHFAQFPLNAITLLDDKLVSGQLSGDLSVSDLHKSGRAEAKLAIDDLHVGSVAYKTARLEAKLDGQSFEGTVRIDQTDGFAEAKAHAVASWGNALSPTLDPAQPVDLGLTSKNFQVAALLPWVSNTFDELDGRLDADTHLSLTPKTQGAKLSGTMALNRGVIEASAGGGELHDISASVRFNPDGTIVLDRLEASGLTGHLQATATARIDGTRIESAKAVVTIPHRSAIPVTAAGTEVGNVEGRIEVSATSSLDGRAMQLAIEIPNLRVVLPEGTSTDVEALGPIENVHIGAHKGSRSSMLLVPLTGAQSLQSKADAQGASTTIAVHISDIEVSRGTDLKVDLDGTIHVQPGGTNEITGQIHLKGGGILNVQGRTFEVDSGTVTFTGNDPSNPEIVVKAGWTAPDGTTVYANFVGPLKTGKVALTSEPTLPQQEIVELLLYGTSDGDQAQSPSATTQNTAIATAGGEAAAPLNHALNQLGLGAVTAKVDTSQSSNPKPEIEVQIAKGISLELAYVLGIPPPGVNPDTTLVTVDWRFKSNWSLASTLGDAGTTIFDLLWKRRY